MHVRKVTRDGNWYRDVPPGLVRGNLTADLFCASSPSFVIEGARTSTWRAANPDRAIPKSSTTDIIHFVTILFLNKQHSHLNDQRKVLRSRVQGLFA
jgi:hypothetical protein